MVIVVELAVLVVIAVVLEVMVMAIVIVVAVVVVVVVMVVVGVVVVVIIIIIAAATVVVAVAVAVAAVVALPLLVESAFGSTASFLLPEPSQVSKRPAAMKKVSMKKVKSKVAMILGGTSSRCARLHVSRLYGSAASNARGARLQLQLAWATSRYESGSSTARWLQSCRTRRYGKNISYFQHEADLLLAVAWKMPTQI